MTITAEQLAQRLRTVREACGMTQEDVAKYLGVSRPTVAQMELGNRGVSGLELESLARLYGRDVRDFFKQEFSPEDALLVLFRSHAEVAEKSPPFEALRDCLELGREITNLEQLIGIDRQGVVLPDYGLPVPKTRWEAIQHGERIAGAERRRLGLGAQPLPNVAELLEGQGVRTAQVVLPDDVSGLTIVASDVGALVVVNSDHPFPRRRFSYAHEYCHVVLDRARQATISKTEERDDVVEVRANAFAAAFLMPPEGVHEFVEGLAKGSPSRLRAEIFDEGEVLRAEGRPEPGSQSIQIYDLALLAHHFDVSRISALYRLKNLKLVNQQEFEQLFALEEDSRGAAIAEFLGLREKDEERDKEGRLEFRRRFLALGLEALRRGSISRRKLEELAAIVDVSGEELDRVVQETGLEEPNEGADALVPEV
jgi:Zn-dependent peptidase ImmA (M78 family)/transcriptional regulator with XRE-family HTH domain